MKIIHINFSGKLTYYLIKSIFNELIALKLFLVNSLILLFITKIFSLKIIYYQYL